MFNLSQEEEAKVTAAFTEALKSAVQAHLDRGGKLSDLDWFSFKPWSIDDRKRAMEN